MPLVALIDQIDKLILQRAEPYEIKPTIMTLRDQAEAMEADAKKKARNSLVENLEAKLADSKREISVLSNKVSELGKKLKEKEIEQQETGENLENTALAILRDYPEGLSESDLRAEFPVRLSVATISEEDFQRCLWALADRNQALRGFGSAWILLPKGAHRLDTEGIP